MNDKPVSRPRPNPLAYLWALLLDTAFILLFALIGRASHHESTGLSGVLETAWPFLAAMLLATVLVVLLGWRPTRPVPAGALVWLLTLAVGMGVRSMAGQGTATPFVVVAAVALLLFLIGWRVLPTLVARMSTRGGASQTDTEKEQRRRAATGQRDRARQPLGEDRPGERRFKDAGEIDR